MQKVIIYNTKNQNFESIEIDNSLTLNETFDKYDEQLEKYKNGNSVFVIDVHLTFKRASNPQDQGGVIIYRHLLEKFKDCQDKLKVIFSSPISRDELVERKHENYVLKCLPFIKRTKNKDGTENKEDFSNKLKSVIAENNFPQFNNASESLLSGWAIERAKKIDLKGKKLLVIDDEWQQWKKTYETIVKGSVDYFLKDIPDIKAEFKKLNNNTFPHSHLDNLTNFDLIISDLYLWERHDPNEWKPEYFINSISGFLLFSLIRDVEPATPVIFHTTSTKFRIYETLSALGADAQIPKNINHNALKIDKSDTYKLFEESIKNSVESYGNCWLNEFYRFISEDKASEKSWWRQKRFSKLDSNTTKEVKDLVKHAILSYKNLKIHNKAHNKEYFKKFFNKNEVDPIAMSVSGIINNLGKIKELIETNNPEIQFFYNLRNAASHATNYHLFRLMDIKIILVLLFQTLKETQNRTSRNINKGQIRDLVEHPLFYYVYYYNKWVKFIPKQILANFEGKITYYMEKYYSEYWKNFNITERNKVKRQFNFIRITPAMSSPFNKEKISDKIIIKFKR